MLATKFMAQHLPSPHTTSSTSISSPEPAAPVLCPVTAPFTWPQHLQRRVPDPCYLAPHPPLQTTQFLTALNHYRKLRYLCVSHLSCLLQRWTSRSSGIPSTQYMSDTQESFNKYSVNEWRCWISNTHSCLKRIVCDSWWHLHIIAWDDRFILSDSPVSPLKAFLASRDSIPPPKKGAREGHSWRRQAQFCLLLPPWYIHSAT